MATVGRGKGGVYRHTIGLREGKIIQTEQAALDARRVGNGRMEMNEMSERGGVPGVQVPVEMQADGWMFACGIERRSLKGERGRRIPFRAAVRNGKEG
ncbi:hypothetical protein GKA01_04210 [Gluconobacter kanchanaburiensis NBRC 103587]|uniref:Uncharacterized protein n=1 Tax=Gluconobacter kanchanaburiensis NBRC 103587 TaxID=1307948 RepID=A0A511B4A5_9PROT|nr:hypothetical protein GKA01_04210 [Gluconobacter kanchanaburiensis NBRC 103587]